MPIAWRFELLAFLMSLPTANSPKKQFSVENLNTNDVITFKCPRCTHGMKIEESKQREAFKTISQQTTRFAWGPYL